MMSSSDIFSEILIDSGRRLQGLNKGKMASLCQDTQSEIERPATLEVLKTNDIFAQNKVRAVQLLGDIL
jgi:hypothetical protein